MPDGLSKLGKDWEYDECGHERGCGCGITKKKINEKRL